MIKGIVLFLVLAVIIGLAIDIFRSLNGREKWALTKTLAYSIMCSAVAFILLSLIVFIF